jgi:hypothetical protein
MPLSISVYASTILSANQTANVGLKLSRKSAFDSFNPILFTIMDLSSNSFFISLISAGFTIAFSVLNKLTNALPFSSTLSTLRVYSFPLKLNLIISPPTYPPFSYFS